MKRFLPGLCCALLLGAFGPVAGASAHWWPWHHHSKSSAGDTASSASAPSAKSKPPKAPKAPKAKKSKHHHHEKTARTENDGSIVTTPGPRTVGWWHKQPGPAGAGAN